LKNVLLRSGFTLWKKRWKGAPDRGLKTRLTPGEKLKKKSGPGDPQKKRLKGEE